MVTLHYDNMHIICNRQTFLRLRKKDILQRKNCDISFFSQTIDCGYTGVNLKCTHTGCFRAK